MNSNKTRMLSVGITLLMLSGFSVVLFADESANDAPVIINDASSEDQAPNDGDITSDTILGGSEGSTTPVTSIPPDTQPPSEDSAPSGDQRDSGEETEYYKFTGVQSISSPIVEKSSFQTSLFTGAASYSYPLELPRGTNGLTPQISLDYNSQSAIGQSGIVGLGWDLGLNYVERDVNYTPDNYSDDRFVLILNGERHDLVYASSDGRYHTQIESYLFINKSISSMNNTFTDYWLVKSKDGVEYQFGFYNGNHVYNSEVVCSRGTYVTRWYLDQIKDTHGNTVTLAYNQSEGAVYPYSIIYSNKEIDFIFENRSDAVTIYVQGGSVTFFAETRSFVSYVL
ncbi:MAG: SpvB/TcaC N-terminal domain-containing protein [Candidatus Altiarchaeia archaeon]